MRLWARLTWQAKDASALAAELALRLGVPSRAGGLVQGAHLLHLGTAELEVRPWVREGPDDYPRAAGRLMLEPVPDGEEPPAPVPAGSMPPAPVPSGSVPPAPAGTDPLWLAGLGWATLELDRAEGELDPWLGPPPPGQATSGAADLSLGARARLRAAAGLPGDWLVLLEPTTEGRAAASLARDGEGPCALYLWPPGGLEAWLDGAEARGVTVSGRRDGPFGLQVLLSGGPAGPHVMLIDGRSPVSAGSPAGTIAP